MDCEEDAIFNICDCELKLIENDINTKIYMSTRCEHSRVVENIYDVAVVRYNETKTKTRSGVRQAQARPKAPSAAAVDTDYVLQRRWDELKR